MINNNNGHLHNLLNTLSQTVSEIAKEVPKNIKEVYEKMSPEHGAEFIKQLEHHKIHTKMKDLSELIEFVKKSRKDGN